MAAASAASRWCSLGCSLLGQLTASFHDRRADPRIDALSRRVRVVADDALDRTFPERYATIVEVATRDGRRLSERVDYARGCPENPVTYEEIVAKFADLAGGAVGAERAARIAGLVGRLEGSGDVDELAALLRDPALG